MSDVEEEQVHRMEIDIDHSYNRRLITPYQFRDRTYHVLFYRNKKQGPFYFVDAAVQPSTMISLGEIRTSRSDELVGSVFYTQAPVICAGSFLLAYSGVFKQSVNNRVPKDFEMDLILKTPRFHIFNKKNRATLVVSPTLKSDIRQNLEI
jgi:hypothetical protein